MKLVKFNNKNFYKNLQKDLNKRYSSIDTKIQNDVKKIINRVKIKGDEALINYTKKFDKILLNKNNLTPNYTSINYKKNIDIKVLESFTKAINNITNFHKK